MTDARPSDRVDRTTSTSAALARLQASRAQLSAALLPPPESARRSADGPSLQRWQAFLSAMARRPVGRVVAALSALARRWWRHQPWHDTTQLLGSAIAQSAAPTIRQHPLAAIVIAAIGGAALAVARPWRWLAMGAPARRWVWSQLSQAQLQMALAGALVTWLAEQRRHHAAPVEASTQPSAPASDEVPTSAASAVAQP